MGAPRLILIIKLLGIIVVLFISGFSILELVVIPWSKLVCGGYFLPLSLGVAVGVFMCSCVEIAISETKESDINSWVKRITENGTKEATKLQKATKYYAEIVTGNSDICNPVVILTNTTILVVYMTILIPLFVRATTDQAVIDIFGIAQ